MVASSPFYRGENQGSGRSCGRLRVRAQLGFGTVAWMPHRFPPRWCYVTWNRMASLRLGNQRLQGLEWLKIASPAPQVGVLCGGHPLSAAQEKRQHCPGRVCKGSPWGQPLGTAPSWLQVLPGKAGQPPVLLALLLLHLAWEQRATLTPTPGLRGPLGPQWSGGGEYVQYDSSGENTHKYIYG